MPTKVVRTADDIDKLHGLLMRMEVPLTVSYAKGDGRSKAQNALAFRWYQDIAGQLGDRTHEDVRAHCKLHHGIPIMRRDDEVYRTEYDRVFKPMAYEAKLHAIRVFDLPVTRNMRVKQMVEFMDAVSREFSAIGVTLTDPEVFERQRGFG
ncbi:hypothetical protein ABWH92_12195 [Ahrensia marina]|uniref:hypothetical protein n=1 Tax=Ahrensia marina TaxID=1514904 RepID=UPI0035CFAB85